VVVVARGGVSGVGDCGRGCGDDDGGGLDMDDLYALQVRTAA
jgi:hypothetical protein